MSIKEEQEMNDVMAEAANQVLANVARKEVNLNERIEKLAARARRIFDDSVRVEMNARTFKYEEIPSISPSLGWSALVRIPVDPSTLGTGDRYIYAPGVWVDDADQALDVLSLILDGHERVSEYLKIARQEPVTDNVGQQTG